MFAKPQNTQLFQRRSSQPMSRCESMKMMHKCMTLAGYSMIR